MKLSQLTLLLLPLLAGAADALAGPKPHIVLVGDSTVTDQSGWGAGFRRFVTDGATVRVFAAGAAGSSADFDFFSIQPLQP